MPRGEGDFWQEANRKLVEGLMRKILFILAVCLLSLTSMAQTSTITSFQGNDSAFATNQPPAGALQLEEGADLSDLSDIMIVDPVPYESIAWMLSLFFGVPAIIIAYCRAWILHRRGSPIIRCRRALQLASLLILVTGILLVVLKVASQVSSITDPNSFPEPAFRAMLLMNVAMVLRLFAVSLTAATVGAVAILMLPFEQNKSL